MEERRKPKENMDVEGDPTRNGEQVVNNSNLFDKEKKILENITCMFGPNFHALEECVTIEEFPIEMFLDTSQTSNSTNATAPCLLVYPSSGKVYPIHNYGRYLELSDKLCGYVPDIDTSTLRSIIDCASPTNGYNSKILSSILFYNKYGSASDFQFITEEGWDHCFNGCSSINASFPDVLYALVKEKLGQFYNDNDYELVDAFLLGMISSVALSISEFYNVSHESDCDSILFPSPNLMSQRHKTSNQDLEGRNLPLTSRSYYWHDPIRMVVLLYVLSLKMKSIIYLRQRNSSLPVKMFDITILQQFIEPILYSVVRTGAWAIAEVRNILEWVVEKILVRYFQHFCYQQKINRKDILNSMGRIIIGWLIIKSASLEKNAGVCTLFNMDGSKPENEFILEPKTSFENYVLNKIPSILFKNEDIIATFKTYFNTNGASGINSKNSNMFVIEEVKKKVSMPIPTGLYFKNRKDLTLTIMDPNSLACSDERLSNSENSISKIIDYKAPKALESKKGIVGSQIGFYSLKKQGFLESSVNVKDNVSASSIFATSSSSSSPSNFYFGNYNTRSNDNKPWGVDGIITGHTVSDKIEHVTLHMPGIASVYNSVLDGQKQSSYTINEMGLETVIWDPLLSSDALEVAADEKTITWDTVHLLKDILCPLKTNEIIIKPKNVISSSNKRSISTEGFQWIWAQMVKTGQVEMVNSKTNNNNIENKIVSTQTQKTIDIINIVSILINDPINNNKIKDNNINNVQKILVSKNQPKNSSLPFDGINKLPLPSLAETDTFIRRHFANILTSLISRIMMIVSNKELEFIKHVSEKTSVVISDSLHIALDPCEAVKKL